MLFVKNLRRKKGIIPDKKKTRQAKQPPPIPKKNPTKQDNSECIPEFHDVLLNSGKVSFLKVYGNEVRVLLCDYLNQAT